MMGNEETVEDIGEMPKMLKRDLMELDADNINLVSSKVSTQNVGNVGTIGAESYGMCSTLKSISGVQTVRFKNEVHERDVTLKFEACAADSSCGEEAEVPANTSMKSFVSDKRPISPGSSHPSAKQPKIEELKNGFHKTDVHTYRISSDQSSTSSDLNNSTKSINSDQSDASSISHEVNNTREQNINNLYTSNLFKRLQLKELRVNLEDVQHKKNLQKAIANSKTYEVEKVVGKKMENHTPFYLIKWKNWSSEYNTWEPKENLTNCDELLKEFEDGRLKLLERFQKYANFYPDTNATEKLMSNLFRRGQKIDSTLVNSDRLYENIDTFFSVDKKSKTSAENIKEGILQMFLYNARNEQLASLKDWENEMNSITKGKPSIKVENLVDLERAPQEFLYIDDYLPGSGVIIPEEPPIGCECSVCDSKTKCCYAMCDGTLPYTSACRIRVPPGTPIYECNKRCICPSDCQNRVVQRGSQMKLCVFRTSNGRGWGVKTLRVIKKGTFVIQYVGEVITNEEAEKRGKEYDAAGRTYLFDLDYNETEGQCPYTVDAAIYGNISHFINHSCDPNLAVYAVWIDCLDPNLPKLALFATKDIKQNEEITFDYMRQTAKDDQLRQRLDLPEEILNNESLENRTRCKCGANICRQYLF